MKKVSTTAKGFVTRILANLNLTEDQQVTSFVSKVIRTLEKEIKTASSNIAVLQSRLDALHETHEEELEDLQSSLEDAYNNVDVNNIRTHEQQNAYVIPYLSNISAAQRVIKQKEEDYKAQVKAIEEEITGYKEKIAKLEENLAVFTE